jgi:hypothetical protein
MTRKRVGLILERTRTEVKKETTELRKGRRKKEEEGVKRRREEEALRSQGKCLRVYNDKGNLIQPIVHTLSNN